MKISGKVFKEKKEAGVALLAVCKDIKSVDAAMDIGSYQGFNMRIQFDSWSKEFILSVKHESVAKVRLGVDALGNITRINNLLESYPEKMAEAEQRLETVQEQLANAKEEVGKPFPKEIESHGMQIKKKIISWSMLANYWEICHWMIFLKGSTLTERKTSVGIPCLSVIS